MEYYFVSDPGPKNDHRPAGHLFANRVTSVALAMHSRSLSSEHHEMSLNIDIKIIRPFNCDGSPIFVMNSWTLVQSCNVVNPAKIISLEFHWLSVTCVQNSVL